MSFIPGPATVSDAAAKLQSLLDAALAQPGVNDQPRDHHPLYYVDEVLGTIIDFPIASVRKAA